MELKVIHNKMRNGDECYHLNDDEGDKIKDKIAQYMEELQDIAESHFMKKYVVINSIIMVLNSVVTIGKNNVYYKIIN